MKKLLNDPADVVVESLAGLAAAHPDLLEVDLGQRVVSRRGGPRPGKVGVISGGGSGHEPLHAGYVGLGMLDAACCGEVFTSPVPDQFVAAHRAADGGAGVVHVLKNYTGDLLNAEMAHDIVQAEGGGALEVVVTGQDIVDKMVAVDTGSQGPFAKDAPMKPIVIKSVSRIPGFKFSQIRYQTPSTIAAQVFKQLISS